jgi:cytoskeletal protein CcmA (bactofilin family)
MFSKQNDRGKAPVPAAFTSAPAPAPEKPHSVSMIAEGLAITGDVTGDGELHLDCSVRGRIIGAVAAQQVRLYATASVEGDITHEQLAMETGANFQGRSLKFKRAEPAPTPALAPIV